MSAEPITTAPSDGRILRRSATTKLLAAVAALGLIVAAWVEWRSFASARDSYEVACGQFSRMGEDAAAIQTLRLEPRAALSRSRPNEELLRQIETALNAVGIDRARWLDSVPQPPVRMAGSEYRIYGTRLYLEGLTRRQLAGFSGKITENDPTLRISSLRLTNRRPETPEFDVEAVVSYQVYAPEKDPGMQQTAALTNDR